jgi:hypothetical protein
MNGSNYQSAPPNTIVTEMNEGCANEPVPSARSPRKKAYKPPKMTEYGNVARLTAGMNGSDIDPGHATGTKRGG